MPEGDTLFKIARTLGAVLTGKPIASVKSSNPKIVAGKLAGQTVANVEARGKNLLIHLGDGRVLWSHLMMSGSWHVYRTGEQWKRPARQLKLSIDVDGFCAALFNAAVCELLTAAELAQHPRLKLGPDASAPGFDAAEATRNLQALGDLALGEAVLRQHALAGLGNVFKSKLLFLLGQDPFVKVADLPAGKLEEIVALGRKLMLENRYTATRITRRSLEGQGTRWVYGRSGQPCRRCATRIKMRRQGQLGRSTYYCPRCQRVPAFAKPDAAG